MMLVTVTVMQEKSQSKMQARKYAADKPFQCLRRGNGKNGCLRIVMNWLNLSLVCNIRQLAVSFSVRVRLS